MADQTGEPQPPPKMIEPIFRNGSVTVVGIVVGFSLNFLSTWVNNPLPWHLVDLLALVPMVLGAGMQVLALAGFLSVSSLQLKYHDRSKNIFLIGLLLVALGIAIAVVLDFLGDGAHPAPR